ncbi:hypothetical protein PENNAL_c0337G09466, partial [Penicillium nalgiovense]
MAGSKRNPPTNRGKQPAVILEEDDESHEQETAAALDPNTPTPDPQRPVDTGDYEEEDESSIRARLQQTPSKERFYELARDHKRLKNRIQELEDEVTVLHAEKVETDMLLKSLQQDCEEAIAHRDIAIRERGDLAFRLVNVQNQISSGAPIVEAAAGRKTTKMPDAPMLNDGKEVRFETWETVIRQKLEANADHYPLPVH